MLKDAKHRRPVQVTRSLAIPEKSGHEKVKAEKTGFEKTDSGSTRTETGSTGTRRARHMMQPSSMNTHKQAAHKFAPVAPVPPISETMVSVPEFMPLTEKTDMQVTEVLLTSAQECITRRDHKAAARLLETALPSLDSFFGTDEGAKLKALRMLRDCYLSLGKGVEAQDCAEVALAIFEDIMSKKTKQHASLTLNPAAFARPVVRKLRTLRRARESEYLRRRSVDISDRWAVFVKSI